jgi:hypothetical protein
MNSRLAILFAAAFAFAGPAVADHPEAEHAVAVPPAVVATKDALRDLWIGHVFWVRNVVDARLASDTARAKASEQQVVANARAIADAVAPYHGEAAADGLFELLAGHWGAISGYLDATVAGDKTDARAAVNRLTANAGEIAAFLSGANDNWPVETLRGLLIAHGAHHVQQIDQLAAKQYAREAVTWTAMKDHMYVIADALATGIASQFPEKFE